MRQASPRAAKCHLYRGSVCGQDPALRWADNDASAQLDARFGKATRTLRKGPMSVSELPTTQELSLGGSNRAVP